MSYSIVGRRTMFDVGSIQEVLKDALLGVLTWAFGYTIGVWKKATPKQVQDAVQPLEIRLTRLEVKTEGFATKTDVDKAVNDLKLMEQRNHETMMRVMDEMKTDIRELRRD